MANSQSFTLSIKALFDASDVRAKVGEIQKAFSNIKLPDNLKGNLDKAFGGVEKAIADFEAKAQKGVSTKADAKGISTSIDGILREFDKLQSAVTQVQGLISEGADLSQFFKLDESAAEKIKGLQQEIEAIQSKIDGIKTDKLSELQKIVNGFRKGSGTAKGATEALELFKKGDIEGAIALLTKLETKLTSVKKGLATRGQDTTSIEATIAQVGVMKTQMGEAQTKISESMGEISSKTAEVANITNSTFQGMAQEIDQAANNTENLNSKLHDTAPSLKDAATNSAQLNTELGQIKSRIQYFVGLTNAVNLFKRAVSSAFNTVKELDAAMTETAVVTDKTISDMWKQLPEYTSRANSLGVTTLDAYKAATLYYQQGLNDQQAAELSNETLKMARIAGLDAAEATDRMTNALRGFNMELNAMNAQRIDDVYSQLAAMSASNVDEISTAMTKVASLANNANMDFETTSAFLAQIIETTRESAETAGTALKTVVARFSEVKKLYSEGELKGTGEEGEVIDVNRISTALRTAGIDLNKYFLGEVGLDDIFMELASKWDSLTSVQQRYIATQAAGSRQQSRFIAMMQDYARTQELVGAAYSANGAAAEQFEKTQSSLQSKLARLKNAWDEFAMGLANNALIKLAVDALTLLLNAVNKLTGAFGPAIGGILKFTTAAVTLIGLRNAFKSGGIVMKGLDKFSNTKIGQFILGTKGQDEAGASAKLTQGGESAKTSMKVGGEAAAKALVEGATEAANIEKGGAAEEVATEQAGATGEVATENLGAMNEVTTEIAGATNEEAIEIEGAVQETTIEKGNINIGNTDLGKGNIDFFKGFGSPETTLRSGTDRNLLTQGTNLITSAPKIDNGAAAISNAIPGIESLGKVASNSADDILNFTNTASSSGKIIANGADDAVNALSKVGAAAPAASNAIGTAAGNAIGTTAGNAAGAAAGAAGLSGLAIAGIAAAVIAVVVGSVALQDYMVSGKREVKQAERETKARERELKETTKLKEAYESYIKNREIAATSTDKSARANAELEMAKALSIITERDKNITTIDRNGNVNIDSRVANERLEQLELLEDQKKTAIGFSEAGEQIAKINEILKKQVTGHEVTTYDEYGNEIGTEFRVSNQSIWANIKNYEAYSRINSEEEMAAYNMQLQAEANQQRALISESIKGLAFKMLDNQDIESNIAESIAASYGEIFSNLNLKDAKLRINDQELINDDLKKLTSIAQDETTGILLEVIGGSYEGSLDPVELRKAWDELNDSQREFLTTLLGDKDFKEYVIELQKSQSSIRKKGYAELKKIGASDDTLKKVIENLSTGQIEELLEYANNWSNFGKDFNAVLFDNISTAMEEGGWDESAFKDFVVNISDNPILAFDQIKEAAENANGKVQDVARSLLKIANTDLAFSKQNQVQWFLTSADFQNIEEDINKIIEANGRLNSSNIEEFAKNSKQLSTLLKNNVLTAQAAAAAFTAIGKGEINFNNLTEPVISGLNRLGEFNDMIRQTIENITNFDIGYDEKTVTDFIDEVYKNVQKKIDTNQWGNNQIKTQMEFIFGKFTGSTGQEYQDWVLKNQEWLEQNKEDTISAWTDLAQANEDGSKKYGEGISIIEQDGELMVDIGSSTSEEVIAAMTASGELTEQQARMMVADLKNMSADFAVLLENNDLENAVEGFLSGLDGKDWYLDKDLQVLADVLETDVDRIREILGRLNPDIKEINFGEGNVEDIQRILTEVGHVGPDDYKINGTVVYDKLQKEMDAVGLGSYFDDFFNAVMEDNGKYFAAFIDGELRNVEIKSGETASQAYSRKVNEVAAQKAQEEMDAQNEAFASTLVTAFSDMFTANPNIEIDNEQALSAIEEVKTQLEKLDGKKANVTITEGGDGEHAATGGVVPGMATGGIISSYANGTQRKIHPGIALTGEEGAEIVWNKERGYAYIAGSHGPEFNNLKPGDQVFNAQDTRAILNRSKFNSFAKGTYDSYAQTKRLSQHEQDKVVITLSTDKVIQPRDEAADGSTTKNVFTTTGGKPITIPLKTGNKKTGGSGSDENDQKPTKKKPEWENTLDWLYNLMEDISELERIQTRLSETHDRYLEDISKTGRDLYNVTKQQLDNLLTQRDNYQEALNRRLQEMREQITEADEELRKYVWWNAEDQTIEIDWDAINEIDNEDTFKEVTDLVSKAEKIQDQIDEAEEAIWNIDGEIKEIESRYLQEFIDFQKRVYDAVVYQYQQQIDELTSLNETLNDSNEKILSSIQREIELQRQIRDNTDKENEISEKEARLAYLRRDTTGANAEEIRSLEKEIEDARESYTDELIDQAIDRLEQQNSDASDQRQHQIDLMTSQLDYWKEVGAFWPEVARLLDEGINGDGSLIRGSTLEEILKGAEGWKAMSEQEREIWGNDLIKEVNQAGVYILEMSKGLDSLSKGIWALIPESSIPEWAREDVPHLATGGLIAETGPAWLDGTVASPEYVLNARQTEAFLKLTDVLPSLLGNADSGTTVKYDNNVHVEVNVNVGEISNDYDIDQLVDRIKTDIYDAATYRNTNSIGITR